MKITLITVVYNADTFLKDCIQSVINQSYNEVEYIVIDGGSTDESVSIIEGFQEFIARFVSEKDEGLYDALNKGIRLATGDIIGILNADDVLADENILKQVVDAFNQNDEIDGVYGNLNYIHPFSKKIIRIWKSKQANFLDIEKGWMPAHPTLYLKKELFMKYDSYALDMGTAADYDLILRFFHVHKISSIYLPILMVNMRVGGVSNQSLKSLLYALKYDYKALKRNKIPNPLTVLFRKKIAKLRQFK
ncbi:glycosyltransferase family 2 protein [Pedobacter aquatilis]|uniref:glycosyltransferase family 2 protein n=1 Tax=Pedobacter aquatilis TaxID=351343 RepID=UPI0029311BC6|nr:glycosyltransferase family 2 protein [Pedobacter aquatilis]